MVEGKKWWKKRSDGRGGKVKKRHTKKYVIKVTY